MTLLVLFREDEFEDESEDSDTSDISDADREVIFMRFLIPTGRYQ